MMCFVLIVVLGLVWDMLDGIISG